MKQWQRLAGGGVLSLALFAGAAGQVTASPLVAEWSYEINNAFEAYDPVAGVVGFDDNAALGSPTRLEWPLSGSARSSLEVDGIQTGTGLQTNGLEVAGATLTHDNRVIPARFADQYLSGGRLRVQVNLTSLDPALPGSKTVEAFFEFKFKETSNDGDCGFQSASDCDDIFAVTDSSGLSQQFIFHGQTYTIIFGSTQLAALDPEACRQVGLGASCIGFLTAENAATDFRTFVRLIGPTAVAVPEPGFLALIGTGLVVLGAVRRRRPA